MYCVSEIYSTEIWIPWLGVACADVRRCHTPVLVQLARAPCLGEQLEIPFVSEQTMHPSCTLMTKSSHPGARLEEVFARGQRIGGGKKVQRIGTACRKCTTSCSQLALEIDFSTMIPLMNFIHLIQSPNSFIQDNPERGHLDPTHFRVILCARPASDSLCRFEKDGWLNRSASGIYVHMTPSKAQPGTLCVMKVEVILLKKGEFWAEQPAARVLWWPSFIDLGGITVYFKLRFCPKAHLDFYNPPNIRCEHHTISSAMLSHLISPTNPNN